MSEPLAKIRLKVGHIEVEYEGSESFVRDDLSTILEKIGDFAKVQDSPIVDAPPSESNQNIAELVTNTKLDLSTNSIASRINAKSAPDLAFAAAAHLTFTKGKNTFKRSDILEAMKEATGYYKSSMASNLTQALQSLVKQQRINETASGTYALSASEKGALDKSLA